jgi:uncharacterized protein (DUF2141 family)
MNKRIGVLILSILSLLAQAAFAGETSGDITFRIGGFSNDRGQVIANLFLEGDDVMKADKAYLQARSTLRGNRAQLVFRNLKHG